MMIMITKMLMMTTRKTELATRPMMIMVISMTATDDHGNFSDCNNDCGNMITIQKIVAINNNKDSGNVCD